MTRILFPMRLTAGTRPRDPLSKTRALIILGAVLASGLLAFALSQDQMILVLMLIFGIAGGLLLRRWPVLGFVLMIFGGMSLPDVGPKNINMPMVMVAVMFVIWLGDMLVIQRKVRFAASRTMLPLLFFLFISILAFGMGQFSWFGFTQNAPLDAQIGGLAVVILSLLAFLLVANQVNDIKWLQVLTWFFIGIGSLHVIVRVVPGLGVVNQAVFRAQAIGGVFWAWFPSLVFSQILVNHRLRPGLKIFLSLMLLGGLYIGLGQTYDWKSGWVPQLLGIATIVALYSWRLGLFLAVLGAYPTFVLIADALVADDYSVSTRIEAWLILREIVKVNPVLGLGFANYYWYTPLFPIRGFAVRFNSHNNFVDIIAQTGLVGLGIFLWFFFELGRVGMRLIHRVPAGFPRAYVYGALGGLVATLAAAMLGDWVLPFVYNIGFSGVRTGILAWIFLGGLVALETLYPPVEAPGDTG